MDKENRLVVKDNALIDASFNLSLIEQRLMLLAIVEAREVVNLTPETPIEVKAITYKDQYKTDQSEAYKQLSEASKQLFNRQFSYIDKYSNKNAVTVSRWVNEVTYVNDKGMVVIYLNRNVISMISRLEKDFTQYLLKQVSEFKSKYSIRLYEILIKHKELSNTKKYSITEIRKLLGLELNEYERIAVLKRDVIDKAVSEINKKTDINVKYDQFKEGRNITHIIFKITKNKANKIKDCRDKNTIDMFNGMTDKQACMFADKLSKDTAFQRHYQAHVGEDMKDYVLRIEDKLKDPFYMDEWATYLADVGYKN
jgi:plasmid replication initiation protein